MKKHDTDKDLFSFSFSYTERYESGICILVCFLKKVQV